MQRTFWEKSTILHIEYYRPAEKPMPDRFSRHYADTAALAIHPVASGAIDQHELRERVISWKRQFFGSAWARYDLAKPGDETGQVRYLAARASAPDAPVAYTPCDTRNPATVLLEARKRQTPERKGWIGARLTLHEDGKFELNYDYPK